jgi:predicted phosphodiesterase
MSLQDLALGLHIEHGLTETYDSLQKTYRKNGWRIPPPRREGGFSIERAYEGIGDDRTPTIAAIYQKNGERLSNLVALWEQVQGDVFREFTALHNDCEDDYEDGDPFQDFLDENPPPTANDIASAPVTADTIQVIVQQVMENMGVKPKEMERPVFKHDIDDIPHTAKILVLGDQHFPYHDITAVASSTAFAGDIQPDYIVLNGDMIDCKTMSKFAKGKWGQFDITQECEYGIRYLDSLRKACPDSDIIFVPGNHEYRIADYLRNQAPALDGIEALELQNLLRFEDFDVILKDQGFRENYIRFDNMYIGHWNKAHKHSAYTVKNLMAELGVNVVQAHVHRIGLHWKRLLDRELVGMEAGCLCKLDAEFTLHTDWQHGFVLITKIGKKYYPELIKMTDGEFIYDGRLWSPEEY